MLFCQSPCFEKEKKKNTVFPEKKSCEKEREKGSKKRRFQEKKKKETKKRRNVELKKDAKRESKHAWQPTDKVTYEVAWHATKIKWCQSVCNVIFHVESLAHKEHTVEFFRKEFRSFEFLNEKTMNSRQKRDPFMGKLEAFVVDNSKRCVLPEPNDQLAHKQDRD